jgi:hypothetical protein
MKRPIPLITALFLSAGTLFAKEQPFYVEAATAFARAQPQNIFAIQPLSELVGKDTDANVILGVGLNAYLKNGERIAKVGLSYIGVPQMKEHSLNLDFKIFIHPLKFFGMTPYFGGVLGVGEQMRKGQSVPVSTNITSIDYISQPNLAAYEVPTTATFNENPYFLRMGFQIGESIRLTEYADLFAAYSYEAKYWQLNYSLATSPGVENHIDQKQNINALRVGVNINF